MNIVILSRSAALYSTHSLFTAARRRGHYVRILDHMHCELVIDTFVPKVLYHGERIQHVDAIIPRIGNAATTYGASVIRQFMLMGAYTTMEPTALHSARDKMSCLQILASHNIKVPTSVVSNTFQSDHDYIKEVGKLPVIMKMINGTHGVGVMLGESENMVDSVLEAMSRAKQKMMLQRYIAESKGADIRVLVVDDEIVGCMKRQAREGDFRSNLHRGGSSQIIDISQQEREIALKAVKVLGLKVAGVDMLQSVQGPMILEVNASPGLEGIETTTGVDIAGKVISLIEKNKQKD